MTPDIPHAKRSLGQHWLVNESVLDRIVAAASVSPEHTVLEVGPGRGALTRRLADTGARILAVEKDRRLIGHLADEFADASNVTIIEGDILSFEPGAYGLAPGTYAVVANIPYYLTSHLIKRLLSVWPAPSRAVLMVQEEVARRMLASPPDMNLLSLSVQLYAQPELLMRVSRGSFRPIPSVDSAIIRVTPRPMDAAERLRIEHALSLARTLFAGKRKQLGSRVPVEKLQAAGVSASARPQELSVSQWLTLGG
jgi:16S rRNA (adenine1518-N6/adenine1519-N6)-dimethyltransferase